MSDREQEPGKVFCPGLGPDLDPGVVQDQGVVPGLGEILGTVRQLRLLLRRPSSCWRLVSSDFGMSKRLTWMQQLLQSFLLLLKGFATRMD